jgi:hypothetical protein
MGRCRGVEPLHRLFHDAGRRFLGDGPRFGSLAEMGKRCRGKIARPKLSLSCFLDGANRFEATNMSEAQKRTSLARLCERVNLSK